MRTVVLGVLVLVGLTSAAVAVKPGDPRVFGGRSESHRPPAPQSDYIAFSTTVENKYNHLTVIVPSQNVILVYHEDLASGAIELRSARNIEADLQLDDYNGKAPLPQEIRQQLGYR